MWVLSSNYELNQQYNGHALQSLFLILRYYLVTADYKMQLEV